MWCLPLLTSLFTCGFPKLARRNWLCKHTSGPRVHSKSIHRSTGPASQRGVRVQARAPGLLTVPLARRTLWFGPSCGQIRSAHGAPPSRARRPASGPLSGGTLGTVALLLDTSDVDAEPWRDAVQEAHTSAGMPRPVD